MKKMELNKQHWLKAKIDNENLILQCKMQIMMAEDILKLVAKELAKFPVEEKKPNPSVQ